MKHLVIGDDYFPYLFVAKRLQKMCAELQETSLQLHTESLEKEKLFEKRIEEKSCQIRKLEERLGIIAEVRECFRKQEKKLTKAELKKREENEAFKKDPSKEAVYLKQIDTLNYKVYDIQSELYAAKKEFEKKEVECMKLSQLVLRLEYHERTIKSQKKHIEIKFEDLLGTGAHFGHVTRKWNPNFKPHILLEYK